MEIPETPSVFFIKGVFKHTARNIHEILELERKHKLQENDFDVDFSNGDEDSSIEPLLKYFNELNEEEWTQQRIVKCTTCPLMTSERAIFIPESIDRVKRKTDVSSVLRWKCYDTCRFCTWFCAAYHIEFFLKNDSRYKLLLTKLYEKWEKKKIVEITSSIHPWRLIEYGGELNIDAFHKINEFNFARFQSSFQSDNDDHHSV